MTKLSFRSFLEALDSAATVSYHPGVQPTQPATFPDLQTYKQYKMQEDPRRANWTDMQWWTQYYFDRSHATKRTKPQAISTPRQ